jgi:hypothetical protein
MLGQLNGTPGVLRRADAPPPNEDTPARERLAAAITAHTEIAAALAENEAARKRAEAAKWASISAVEKAKAAFEEAQVADAQAIAAGEAPSALKLARAALVDAEDGLATARRAEAMLKGQRAALAGREAILAGNVDAAVAAVLKGSDETRALIDDFFEARRRYCELFLALRALWAANGLTDAVNGWDYTLLERDMPPSSTADAVKDWIEKLRTDAGAMLKVS